MGVVFGDEIVCFKYVTKTMRVQLIVGVILFVLLQAITFSEGSDATASVILGVTSVLQLTGNVILVARMIAGNVGCLKAYQLCLQTFKAITSCLIFLIPIYGCIDTFVLAPERQAQGLIGDISVVSQICTPLCVPCAGIQAYCEILEFMKIRAARKGATTSSSTSESNEVKA